MYDDWACKWMDEVSDIDIESVIDERIAELADCDPGDDSFVRWLELLNIKHIIAAARKALKLAEEMK